MRGTRKELARKRLLSVLGRHVIATARTLEQKISDAGPNDQRIDPHVLTAVRTTLVRQEEISKRKEGGVPWFYLPGENPSTVQARLQEQLPVYEALRRNKLPQRIGQCLEIAIHRALLRQRQLEHFGRFRDLDIHDDSTLYAKVEPPQYISERQLPGELQLDFLVRHPDAGWAAIEAKNTRPWIYPQERSGPNPLITGLLEKSLALDCVPVLIARRLSFVASKLLIACGVLVHQTFNQFFPEADQELAARASNRNLLGYHDIRTGNAPDNRLLKFVGVDLPKLLPATRLRFEQHKDLLEGFATKEMGYEEFAARVRRRSKGMNEDYDPPDDSDDHDLPDDSDDHVRIF